MKNKIKFIRIEIKLKYNCHKRQKKFKQRKKKGIWVISFIQVGLLPSHELRINFFRSLFTEKRKKKISKLQKK